MNARAVSARLQATTIVPFSMRLVEARLVLLPALVVTEKGILLNELAGLRIFGLR